MKNLILKTVALTFSVGAILMTTGCSPKVEQSKVEPPKSHTYYTACGRYYTDGTITTTHKTDALWWKYSTDTISDIPVYDDMPIYVVFDDNGTPDIIKDDVPLGLVYDRATAIYDELETALGTEFEIERTENNIKIGGIKND